MSICGNRPDTSRLNIVNIGKFLLKRQKKQGVQMSVAYDAYQKDALAV